jgi:hypothetical protein
MSVAFWEKLKLLFNFLYLCCNVRFITGQIFDAISLAYVVLILPSYPIVLTDLKLNFLAAMNVHFSISVHSVCDILLPLSFLLSYRPNCFFAFSFAQQLDCFTHCFSDWILQAKWTYKLKWDEVVNIRRLTVLRIGEEGFSVWVVTEGGVCVCVLTERVVTSSVDAKNNKI